MQFAAVLAVAFTFWGGPPPDCERVEVVPVASMPEYIGYADYNGGDCKILITRSLAEPWRCGVMVHEVGHLYGYEHSTDPRNVMYAGPKLFIPRICKRRHV